MLQSLGLNLVEQTLQRIIINPLREWNISSDKVKREEIAIIPLLLIIFSLVIDEVVISTVNVSIYIVLYVIIGLFSIVYSLVLIINRVKKKQFFLKKWDAFLVGMMVWGLISTIISDDVFLSVFGTEYRFDGYFSYLIYSSMYIIVRLACNDKKRIYVVKALAVTSTILCARWVIYEDITSVFRNSNHFAYILVIGTALYLGFIMYETIAKKLIIYIILFTINIFTLIYNNTFGGYLAIIFAIIYSTIVVLVINRKMFPNILLCVVVFIMASVVIDMQTNIVTNNFVSLFTDTEKVIENRDESDASGSGRIKLWRQAFKYIKDRPMFGYGPEGTTNMYIDDGFDNDRPHNEFIQCALFMGIPALLMYIGALILISIYGIGNLKTLGPEVIIASIAVVGYCISSFFGNTMYYTTPYYWMVIGVVSAMEDKLVNRKIK